MSRPMAPRRLSHTLSSALSGIWKGMHRAFHLLFGVIHSQFENGVHGRCRVEKRLGVSTTYYHLWLSEYLLASALTGRIVHWFTTRVLKNQYGLSGKVLLLPHQSKVQLVLARLIVALGLSKEDTVHNGGDRVPVSSEFDGFVGVYT